MDIMGILAPLNPLIPMFSTGITCSMDPGDSRRTRMLFDDVRLIIAASVRLMPCADNSDAGSCKEMEASTPRNPTRDCCSEDSRTRICANVSTWYIVIASDAKIDALELNGDARDVTSVEVRDEIKDGRSCAVMRTSRVFNVDLANAIANVTSSTGVFEMIRRGVEERDNSREACTREGRKKDVGGVI